MVDQRQIDRARGLLKRAVWNGTLTRADVCELCGNTGPTEGHHHKGYEPEHELDVQWLCKPCHGRVHTIPAMTAARTPESYARAGRANSATKLSRYTAEERAEFSRRGWATRRRRAAHRG